MPTVQSGRKMYVCTFAVMGAGDFPVDMLRYDSAYPDTQQDAAAIHDTFNVMSGPDRVTVKLVHVGPNKHWEPTRRRWESFGWSVCSSESI